MSKLSKFSRYGAVLAGVVANCVAGLAQATLLQLAPINSLTTTTYNNFQIQSMDLNQKCSAALDARCLPSGPYPVQSSPGQIYDQLVILSGVDNPNVNNTPSPLGLNAADDPFETPTGGQSSSFAMTVPDATGSPIGDQAGTWEVSLSALVSYLGTGNGLVFFFDNNQEGSGPNQSLNIWGQARIINTSGVEQACFEFSLGSGCGTTNPALGTYVPAIANYCVDKVTALAYKVGSANSATDCTNNVGDFFVNDNLGNSTAEYAIFSSALNNGLQAWADAGYLLSVNMRYNGNNDGAEQLWISSGLETNFVPEPASLALFGLGLVGLAVVRRQRR